MALCNRGRITVSSPYQQPAFSRHNRKMSGCSSQVANKVGMPAAATTRTDIADPDSFAHASHLYKTRMNELRNRTTELEDQLRAEKEYSECLELRVQFERVRLGNSAADDANDSQGAAAQVGQTETPGGMDIQSDGTAPAHAFSTWTVVRRYNYMVNELRNRTTELEDLLRAEKEYSECLDLHIRLSIASA